MRNTLYLHCYCCAQRYFSQNKNIFHLLVTSVEAKKWLKKQAQKELDIMPQTGKNSEFIFENGSPIAHYCLSKRGRYTELNGLIVHPDHRCRGLTYKILDRCDNNVIVFTRNEFLKKALIKSDFLQRKINYRMPLISIILDRISKSLILILTLDFKRLFHQIKNLRKYKLYVREKLT